MWWRLKHGSGGCGNLITMRLLGERRPPLSSPAIQRVRVRRGVVLVLLVGVLVVFQATEFHLLRGSASALHSRRLRRKGLETERKTFRDEVVGEASECKRDLSLKQIH